MTSVVNNVTKTPGRIIKSSTGLSRLANCGGIMDCLNGERGKYTKLADTGIELNDFAKDAKDLIVAPTEDEVSRQYVIKYHLFVIAAFILLPCISILHFTGSSSSMGRVFAFYEAQGPGAYDVYKTGVQYDENSQAQLEGAGYTCSNGFCNFHDNRDKGLCANVLVDGASALCNQYENVEASLTTTWWLVLVMCFLLGTMICVGEKWNEAEKSVGMAFADSNGVGSRNFGYGLMLGCNVAILVLNSKYNYNYLQPVEDIVAHAGKFDDNINLGATMMTAASRTLMVYSWVFFALLVAKLVLNKFHVQDDSEGGIKVDGFDGKNNTPVIFGAAPMKGIELADRARLITDPKMLSNRVRALQK